MIGHTHIRWDNLILVRVIIYKFAQIVHQLNLRGYLGQFGLVHRTLTERLCCIHLELSNGIALLIVLQCIFGCSQFGINLLQTTVDKFLGLQGYLVLISISLAVITDGQLIQIVKSATGTLVGERQLGYRGLL